MQILLVATCIPIAHASNAYTLVQGFLLFALLNELYVNSVKICMAAFILGRLVINAWFSNPRPTRKAVNMHIDRSKKNSHKNRYMTRLL